MSCYSGLVDRFLGLFFYQCHKMRQSVRHHHHQEVMKKEVKMRHNRNPQNRHSKTSSKANNHITYITFFFVGLNLKDLPRGRSEDSMPLYTLTGANKGIIRKRGLLSACQNKVHATCSLIGNSWGR